MSIFFIHTSLDPNRSIPDDVRMEHLEYIRQRSEIIRFAGVKINTDNDYTGICYYVQCNSIESAEEFIKNDPYCSHYTNVCVDKFLQRIP